MSDRTKVKQSTVCGGAGKGRQSRVAVHHAACQAEEEDVRRRQAAGFEAEAQVARSG